MCGDSWCSTSLSFRKAAVERNNGRPILKDKEWGDNYSELDDANNRLNQNNLDHNDPNSDNVMLHFKDDRVYPILIDFGSCERKIERILGKSSKTAPAPKAALSSHGRRKPNLLRSRTGR